MLQNIYYSRKSNQAVQVLSQCRILPEETDAVCYQELYGSFQVYVMERKLFDETFFKKRQEKDNIQSRSKDSRDSDNSEVSKLIRFLDADTYGEKIKILEGMKDELNEHLLNNMAVSLDLSIEDGVDGYSFLMSELKIRSRFEGNRGGRR